MITRCRAPARPPTAMSGSRISSRSSCNSKRVDANLGWHAPSVPTKVGTYQSRICLPDGPVDANLGWHTADVSTKVDTYQNMVRLPSTIVECFYLQRFSQRRQIHRTTHCNVPGFTRQQVQQVVFDLDRKSTRLNSSHSQISYAVFC